jgi:hypothetical protein
MTRLLYTPEQEQQLKKESKSSGGGAYTPYMSTLEFDTPYRIALVAPEDVNVPTSIVFYEAWGVKPDGKKSPQRFETEPTPSEIEEKFNELTLIRPENRYGEGPDPVRKGIAYSVWNYQTSQIEVLSTTTYGVWNGITEISALEDYRSKMFDIDLSIVKANNSGKTSYKVNAVPRRDGATDIIKAAWALTQKEGEFDLRRMYSGGNPFSA